MSDERVRVPVFYVLSPSVADRAIDRFRAARAAADAGEWAPRIDMEYTVEGYVHEETEPDPVIYVDDVPFGEYAADAGVETLSFNGTPDT